MNTNKNLTTSVIATSTVMVPSMASEAQEPTAIGKFGWLEHTVYAVKTASDGMKLMTKEGHNVTSGATTLFDGLGDMFTFSPFGVVKGGVKVVSGCLTIRDAWGRVFGHIGNLDAVLRGAQASLDAIKHYGELNQKEAKDIQAKAKALGDDYKALEARLEAVNAIADNGSEHIKQLKEAATAEINKALDQISKAKKSFVKAQEDQKKAENLLMGAKLQFIEMLELSESTEGSIEQRFEKFKELAQDGPFFCGKAIKVLQEAQEAVNAGLVELDEARGTQLNALLQLADVEAVSKAFAQEIKAQTLIGSLKVSIEEKIEKIQECAQNIVDNIEKEFVIVERVQRDLEDLRDEVNKRWTNGEVIAGAVAAAVAPGGLLVKAGAFYAGATVWRNKESIRESVEKVFVKPFPAQKPQVEGLLTFKFDDKSTGYFNRYYKKQASKTCGRLTIDLGNGSNFTCQVNFNNKWDAIRTEDLVQLNKLMHEKLKDGSMSPERCLEITEQLRTLAIDRGSDHKKKGNFITNDCPYIAAEMYAEGIIKRATVIAAA